MLEPASGEEPVIPMPKGHPSHDKAVAQQTHAQEIAKKPTHEDEKIALVLALTGGFAILEIRKWSFWRKLPLFDHFCDAPTQ